MHGGRPGAAKYKKYIRARENRLKKNKTKQNNARPVALESVPTMALKEFMQEKCSRKNIDAARKFPSPTIAFQIVRP